MKRLMMAALLLALAGCAWGEDNSYPSTSGAYSNNGGGPGPGGVPINPGATGR
jgi:hypothetical protein